MVACLLDRFHSGGRRLYFGKTFELFFDQGCAATAACADGIWVTGDVVSRWSSQGFIDHSAANVGFKFLFGCQRSAAGS